MWPALSLSAVPGAADAASRGVRTSAPPNAVKPRPSWRRVGPPPALSAVEAVEAVETIEEPSVIAA
ncbi:hypothetical protein AB0D14_21730 [Streptomyces sp. NPDC048484]|uniref:hypothetical protein n=1 Tax=Streptomyces sp. NPDC048484 TaxID=3155146 RepID=UPI003417D681